MRGGFYVEEDTLEELPVDEVVEGELDLMKSFPVYQAVPAKSGPHHHVIGERDHK